MAAQPRQHRAALELDRVLAHVQESVLVVCRLLNVIILLGHREPPHLSSHQCAAARIGARPLGRGGADRRSSRTRRPSSRSGSGSSGTRT